MAGIIRSLRFFYSLIFSGLEVLNIARNSGEVGGTSSHNLKIPKSNKSDRTIAIIENAKMTR